ncbi:hypothetical protein CQW23_17308 [Capsicum baccatum]|uniref:CCHC-type domain-containing protein n=1 Tax=Capsicum baccatum TaxID=33114 RepID=A0A2G2WDF2_CAPBA|nr:hypothetical protein CQW23_17308 [Capsicum baccatum]
MDVPSNLVLKASVATYSFEESETDRIVKRVLKALERSGAFSKRGKSNGGSKAGKGNNTCHKCYKLGHYIKDCPMHKIDYKKYANQDTNTDNEEERKLKGDLAKYEEQMVELSVQIVKHQATCKTLACENDLLNKRVDEISKKESKGRNEGRRIQFQLEEDLINVKANLTSSLDRNSILEEKLVKMKTILEKPLK